MKAIVRSGYGPPDILQLAETEKPTPGSNEALVRVHASSINMADVDYLLGRPKVARFGTGLRRPRNQGLGLDVAGQVEAVGPAVARFKPGDDVFGDLTEHGFGAFAEYACAPESAFAPKPSGLTFEEAATVPQAAVMALQGLRSKKQIRQGDKVLINGAGGNIGPFAVQIAKAFGAEVTGVDNTEKQDLLRSLGADHVIDFTQMDYVDGGSQYDWILDVAAFRSIFESKRALSPGGTYVMVPGTMTQVFQAMVVAPLVSVTGNRKMGLLPWKPFRQEDVAFLTELIEAGKIKPVIDRTYKLSEVPRALREQGDGQVRGKLVITM